jgi:hypothetical protein
VLRLHPNLSLTLQPGYSRCFMLATTSASPLLLLLLLLLLQV